MKDTLKVQKFIGHERAQPFVVLPARVSREFGWDKGTVLSYHYETNADGQNIFMVWLDQKPELHNVTHNV